MAVKHSGGAAIIRGCFTASQLEHHFVFVTQICVDCKTFGDKQDETIDICKGANTFPSSGADFFFI